MYLLTKPKRLLVVVSFFGNLTPRVFLEFIQIIVSSEKIISMSFEKN